MVAETEFRCMECGEEWVCYEDEDLSVECPDCGSTDIGWNNVRRFKV